ncbi:MAG: TatD family deoxyribonuclease [Epsilonproteobacteria bacterium]|nr:MAG: TatD family deoxyribonuclease [Campylobacterota bacterium]RLA66437.1 MAG: TatD family deoxyribonuclease [Campylobacterota bacterium]
MGKRKSYEETLENLSFIENGRSKFPLIETHCHLDYIKSITPKENVEKSHKLGIEKLITISVTPSNLDTVLNLTNTFENVFCSQGVHPHDAKDWDKTVLGKIKENTMSSKKVVAIGEIGLDFHYDSSPRDLQMSAFEEQLELAMDLKLPVIIHTREAEDETMAILKNFPKIKGVAHSFTSSLKLAEYLIDSGLYLGFNGIISFKKAEGVRAALEMTPLNRILLETDSPFLAPAPHRGKENAPIYLPFVAQKVLEVKNISAEIGLPQIHQNTLDLFPFC